MTCATFRCYVATVYTLVHIYFFNPILLYVCCTYVQMSSVSNVPQPPTKKEEKTKEEITDEKIKVISHHSINTHYMYMPCHLYQLYHMQDLAKFQKLQIKDN